ncbi:SDR family oxidoreductase [Synechococcus sp. UW105]|uniref:SDR family oxidoreductase n=1 Tax=Synechococcus sp. UW105 TaxID=337067 RepID=UPI000E0F7F62|nr:NAD(P)H-binding protein [Synechococcus sp. UW105]
MTISVSGANGFTGRFVCSELLRRQLPFIAVLRPGNDPSWMLNKRIRYRFADLEDPQQFVHALRGCSSLLHVASIGFGSAPSIIESCKRAGISRVVFVSTTSIYTKLNAGSKKVRLAAEASIKSSSLDYTIIRPTMIYGTNRDRNMIRLVRWIDRWPILPVFGDGLSLQQPVHVSDVAWTLVESLQHPESIGLDFNISGEEPLTYNEVVRLIAFYLGRPLIRIHIPFTPVVYLLKLLEFFQLFLPLKSEQILRLNENKNFSYTNAAHILGYKPISFHEGIQMEVSLYRGIDL